MHEKLVEHWLTSANELGYQIPFCEVLIARGFEIIHVSTHGRGEHGKDIIARSANGGLWTFQLKGGDIALSDWRRMRTEVAELVELPVRFPGVSESEAHTPVLVTNGEIRGDAIENIKRYAKLWRKNGGAPVSWPGWAASRTASSCSSAPTSAHPASRRRATTSSAPARTARPRRSTSCASR